MYHVDLHTYLEVDMKLNELFPYQYVGGGYFRRKKVPKGKSAKVLHGEQAIQYLYDKLSDKHTIKIFKEKPGIISKDPVWVCLCGPYMYIHDSIRGLFAIMADEWENDKHLIG